MEGNESCPLWLGFPLAEPTFRIIWVDNHITNGASRSIFRIAYKVCSMHFKRTEQSVSLLKPIS